MALEKELNYNGLVMHRQVDWRNAPPTHDHWWVKIDSLDGLWDAEIRDQTEPLPGKHGARSFDSFYGPKTITIAGRVEAYTLTGLRAGQRALQLAFGDLKMHFLTVQLWNETKLQISCKKVQPLAMVEAQAGPKFARAFTVAVRADDPRFYGVLLETYTIEKMGIRLQATRDYPTIYTNRFVNPSFEAADISAWSGSGFTLARDSAVFNPGFGSLWSLKLTATGAGPVVSQTFAISGATVGRRFSDGFWINVPSGSSLIGKDANIQVGESGGATGYEDSSTTAQLRAGWQRIAHSRALLRNDRTGVLGRIWIPSGVTGEILYIDDATLIEAPLAAVSNDWYAGTRKHRGYTGGPPRTRQYGGGAIILQGVTNEGNAESYPVTELYGPLNSPLYFYNRTTNKQLTWSAYNIPSGSFLRIDHGAGTIKLNGITDIFTGFDVAASEFWPLEPGFNELAIVPASSGTGARGVISWRRATR